jgi:hypothetical protein
VHIQEFKKSLTQEIAQHSQELAEMREQKKALELVISDLFAIKAKHANEPAVVSSGDDAGRSGALANHPCLKTATAVPTGASHAANTSAANDPTRSYTQTSTIPTTLTCIHSSVDLRCIRMVWFWPMIVIVTCEASLYVNEALPTTRPDSRSPSTKLHADRASNPDLAGQAQGICPPLRGTSDHTFG